MSINARELNKNYDFEIDRASHIGRPMNNTAMFITKKIENQLSALDGISDCVIFTEQSIEVPEEFANKNGFVFCGNPQREYAKFMTRVADERFAIDKKRKYSLTSNGYYIGEDVRIESNAYIEPGCVIGHGVTIGDNAVIKAESIIKNAVIVHNVLIQEKTAIVDGFTMCRDEENNLYRIPTLGKVQIGNYVEVGVSDNISAGSGGDIIIDDYVKLDAMVHIGHDVHLHKNTEITAGVVVGGFVDAGADTYMGINSVVRNRLTLGKGSRVSMGAVVTRSVEDNQTVTGNFAVDHKRFITELKRSNEMYKEISGGYFRIVQNGVSAPLSVERRLRDEKLFCA